MKKYRILIVDDQFEQLEQIITIVEESGMNYDLFEALDVKTALYIAHKEMPDLIITDWEMPEVNGLEFIKLLKSDIRMKDIPVMMCTGVMTSSENLKIALEAGFIDFIRKPIDKIELLARIRAMLTLFETNKKNIEQKEVIHRQEKTILEQKAQMLDNELKAKENELSSFLIRFAQEADKQKILIEKLKGIKELPAKKINAEINRMVKMIIENTKKINETEFSERFDMLYSGFFSRLKYRFPRLTPYEMKLCSYFLLNLSTKEIANLMFISYAAARKARTRLRKKIGITEDDDLYKILLEI